MYVGVPGDEVIRRVAHGRAAVAAAAGLVKHEGAVLAPEAAENIHCLRGDVNAADRSWHGLEEAELLRGVGH
jgi:hypothetical protein